MKRKISGAVLSAAMAASLSAGVVAATPVTAEAKGCTWYVYTTVKDTTYWEYRTGNTVNRGFWQRPDKNSRIKTNVPFNGRNRTPVKYEHWYGKWRKLSATKTFPYINRGAVKYEYCY